MRPNGFPIEPPDGAHAALRLEIEELQEMAADCFSGAVNDHIGAALAAVDAGDPVAARAALERASEMMDGERRPGEWWRK